MKSRIQVPIMLAAVAFSGSTVQFQTGPGMTGTDGTKSLSKGAHLPPVSAPQAGGAPVGCPAGYTCAKW